MEKARVRKIINEEVKKHLSKNAFGEEFEYIISEATLNELDLGGMFKSGLSFVKDNLGDASTNAIKQFLITQLLQFLENAGLPIKTDSIFGSVLINTLQNLTASDMADYFTPDGCEKVADRIIKGIQEGLQEDLVIDSIVELFFGAGSRMEGLLGSPIRELIDIKLNDMTESLRKPLVDFACNHRDFGKLKSDIMGAAGSQSSSDEDAIGPDDSLVRLR